MAMYNHNTHTWQHATITTNVLSTPRSYILSTDNRGSYRRNRQHTPLILLHPVRLQLQHLVVMLVVKMLHNHQMDQLTMNIMSLNLGAYLNQHLDINSDIDENTD